MSRSTVRRRAIRFGLLASNAVVLGVILMIVLHNSHSTQVTSATPLANETPTAAVANPLDQVSSADIALTVARMSSLPEATAITNQAQSQAADAAIAPSNNDVLTKPQVVATALKSKADIKDYIVVAGDTVPGVAAKFGVTSDSIRWSNDVSGDALNVGAKLLIPPVSGIIYTVKSGDTPDSLAAKFRADKDKIVAYNDAEIGGLAVGEQIIIPDATKVAPAAARASAYFSWGGAAPIYGYNGYDYGYCTWWVATRRSQVGMPVPANLGNASSWAYIARAAGLPTGYTPKQYAAAVTGTRGEGHVVFVESVNPDGSIVISEMNHLGWNVKDTETIPAAQAANYSYIY
jgi:surface antigen